MKNRALIFTIGFLMTVNFPILNVSADITNNPYFMDVKTSIKKVSGDEINAAEKMASSTSSETETNFLQASTTATPYGHTIATLDNFGEKGRSYYSEQQPAYTGSLNTTRPYGYILQNGTIASDSTFQNYINGWWPAIYKTGTYYYMATCFLLDNLKNYQDESYFTDTDSANSKYWQRSDSKGRYITQESWLRFGFDYKTPLISSGPMLTKFFDSEINESGAYSGRYVTKTELISNYVSLNTVDRFGNPYSYSGPVGQEDVHTNFVGWIGSSPVKYLSTNSVFQKTNEFRTYLLNRGGGVIGYAYIYPEETVTFTDYKGLLPDKPADSISYSRDVLDTSKVTLTFDIAGANKTYGATKANTVNPRKETFDLLEYNGDTSVKPGDEPEDGEIDYWHTSIAGTVKLVRPGGDPANPDDLLYSQPFAITAPNNKIKITAVVPNMPEGSKAMIDYGYDANLRYLAQKEVHRKDMYSANLAGTSYGKYTYSGIKNLLNGLDSSWNVTDIASIDKYHNDHNYVVKTYVSMKIHQTAAPYVIIGVPTIIPPNYPPSGAPTIDISVEPFKPTTKVEGGKIRATITVTNQSRPSYITSNATNDKTYDPPKFAASEPPPEGVSWQDNIVVNSVRIISKSSGDVIFEDSAPYVSSPSSNTKVFQTPWFAAKKNEVGDAIVEVSLTYDFFSRYCYNSPSVLYKNPATNNMEVAPKESYKTISKTGINITDDSHTFTIYGISSTSSK